MPRAVTTAEIDHYRRHGYVVIERFLAPDEVARALPEIGRFFPSGDELAAHPERYRDLKLDLMCPAGPIGSAFLDDMSVHPELLSFARRALGIEDPFLVQGGLHAKYHHTSVDQDLHRDFSNNELGYPSRKPRYSQLSMMLYYHDVTPANTPTHVVADEHTGGLGVAGSWSRHAAPELYAKEVAATCPAGSIFAWNMRTVHRGSAMRDPRGCRVHQGFVVASASCRWLGMAGWGLYGGRPEMDRMLVAATPEGRTALGFPPPGHDYWDEETLAGVAVRYPQMEMEPYRRAMPKRRSMA
jgi:hypothetical protein